MTKFARLIKGLPVLLACNVAISADFGSILSSEKLPQVESNFVPPENSTTSHGATSSSKYFLASASGVREKPPGASLVIAKVSSGIIDSDNFNDGELNSSKWVAMQHSEIHPSEKDGWLVIRGTPSNKAKGWWHAGAMTRRAVNKGLPDLVMAVKYQLPNWDYPCTSDWNEFPIYQAHLCNDTPDVNHSIQISRMCPSGKSTRALFGGLTESQMPKRQIVEQGVEMFVSYNDGRAQGFMLDKNGKVHAVTKEKEVQMENYKRMELKSVLAPIGVEVYLKVDWAVLYPQPADVPAHFELKNVAATEIRVVIGDWTTIAPVTKGVASVYLPTSNIYPSAASISIIGDGQTIDVVSISRKGDLGGLYPGDIWKISTK